MTDLSDGPETEAAYSLSLSRNRDFLLLLGGQAISSIGTRMSMVAFPLFVLARTRSPALTGLTSFFGVLPYALFYLPAGVLVDRWDRKRIMIATDTVRAAAFISIPIAEAFRTVTVEQLMAVIFVEGTGFVLFSLAEFAALPNVVTSEQIPTATARNEARLRGSALLGAPLGGFCFGLSRALPFLVDAITYILSAVSLTFVRASFQQDHEKEPAKLVAAVREGIAWLWSRRFLRVCTILVSVSNVMTQAMILVIVVLARTRGGNSLAVGLILGVASGAGFIGSFFGPRLHHRRISPKVGVIGFYAILAAIFVVLAPRTPPLTLGVLFAVPAFVVPILNVMLTSYELAVIPDRLLGRVRSAIMLISWGTLPLGSLIAGLLLQSAGRTLTPVILGAVTLIVGFGALFSRSLSTAPSLDGSDKREWNVKSDSVV